MNNCQLNSNVPSSASSTNIRRSSLGNYFPSYSSVQNIKTEVNNPNKFISPSTSSFLGCNEVNMNSLNNINYERCNKLQQNFLSSNIDETSPGESMLSSSMILALQQKKLQQKCINNQNYLKNFVKPNLNNNNFSTQDTYHRNECMGKRNIDILLSQSSYPSNMLLQQQQRNFLERENMRRRSYCAANLSLLPVKESRSSSPINLAAQQHHQLEFEDKLSILINSQLSATPPSPVLHSLSASSAVMPKVFEQNKLRLRTFSTESNNVSYDSSGNSYLADLTSTSSIFEKSLRKLNHTALTNLNIHKLDSFDEKLAITGNIFKKRDDWLIINKVPINKQNTMHMRLEDEGPFGNDEIRCFVLSHLSSLSVKKINCIFCDCELVVYDRFPLVDGTLFLSPVSYDMKNSLPCVLERIQKHFINAICLKCLTNEKDHEINCKNCKISWHQLGGASLQIGTLYKYDVFAAFPCCQLRLNCNACNHPVLTLADSHSLPCFSYFSEEKECPRCKTRAFHFIKPLDYIYEKSICKDIVKNS